MANNTMGQFIAALRKTNGMTQQEVADRLNVSNKAVSRWERDECAPDISVIPALAEMFDVTCDELLKGERIFGSSSEGKKEPRVEKQIKKLFNQILYSFKTLTLISMAVAVVGLVCMFGISYSFYRPPIGFAVMLLFETAAAVMAIVAINRLRYAKNGNELFDTADEALIRKFNSTFGKMSFSALFMVFAAVVLSLPVVISGDFEVITAYDYFTNFFGGLAVLLILIFIKYQKVYTALLTGTQKLKEPGCIKAMTVIQAVLVIITCFLLPACLLLILSAFSPITYIPFSLAPLTWFIVSVVCFIIFFIACKAHRKRILYIGIRNILLVPAVFFVNVTIMNMFNFYFNDVLHNLWYWITVVVFFTAIFLPTDILFIRRKSDNGKEAA